MRSTHTSEEWLGIIRATEEARARGMRREEYLRSQGITPGTYSSAKHALKAQWLA